MSARPTLTAIFISSPYRAEGHMVVAEKVRESAGAITFPSVACSGAATAAIVRA